MKIFHTKVFQFVQVDKIDYSQYEQIADILYTDMPNNMVSAQFRKNLNTGFFVMLSNQMSNKIVELLNNPPPPMIPPTPPPKKSTKAKDDKS